MELGRTAALRAGEPQVATSRAQERDPSMDSLRFIAVSLVVLLHFLTPVAGTGGPIDGLFFATWTLRVPLLIFVSGWFSSAELPTKRSITRLLQSIVVVYLLFDMLQRLQIYLLVGSWRLDFDKPIFGMWFLLTVGTWRVILPYVARIRWFGVLAVAGSLLGGFTGAGQSFSMGHTIALFPIFLLGWYARQVGLRDLLKRTPAKIAALAVMIASTALGWVLRGTIDRRMVGMYGGYRGDGLEEFWWRVAFLLWAGAVVLAMLSLIPRRRIPLVSVCGAGSMYAYILHQLIQRQWLNLGGPDLASDAGPVGVLVLGLAALALVVVLTLPQVRWLFRPLIQPRWTWFLRDRESVRAASGTGDDRSDSLSPAGARSGQARPDR